MLVEKWLYDHLRRPEIIVEGEVLTDLFSSTKVDWITQVASLSDGIGGHQSIAPEITLWGGCESNAISVYLASSTPTINVIGNYRAGPLFVRMNSAMQIAEICARDYKSFGDEAALFGLPQDLCAHDWLKQGAPGTVFVFNTCRDAGDAHYYRHKVHGWVIHVEARVLPGINLCTLAWEDLIARLYQLNNLTPEARDEIIRICLHLKLHYNSIRPSAEERAAYLRSLIQSIPTGSKVVFCVEYNKLRNKDSTMRPAPWIDHYREVIRSSIEGYSFAGMIDFRDAVADDREVQSANHYDRAVYFRASQLIIAEINKLLPKSANAQEAA